MALGYIRRESDMKFLILFILDVIGEAVAEESLLEAVLTDECADYFTFSEALAELMSDGFVAESNKGYGITALGKTNFNALGNVLPYSVRRNAEAAATKAVAAAKRAALISTDTQKSEEGNFFTTRLSMSDGRDEILSLSLLTVKSEQGADIEANFARNAEKIYRRVLAALLDEYPEDKAEDTTDS